MQKQPNGFALVVLLKRTSFRGAIHYYYTLHATVKIPNG